MQANVRLDHTLLAVDGEHDVHAMLEIAVPEAPSTRDQPPLRLALVLDRSGSMRGAKLETAKRCAAWLVSRLRVKDEIALVDYDSSVRLLAPLAPTDSDYLRAALGHVRPGGQTNLSGGWLKGLEQLHGAPGRILLLTDGLANVGITESDALVELARSASGERIGTSTIGFGERFDEELLTAMADASGGSAHYAETPDAAPAIFAQELEGLTSIVAQNLSVEIRPREHVEILGVLNEYPHVPVAGGIQVQLGDAYGGETRRVVFEVHVPRLVELGPVTVADLMLRYVSVGDEIAAHELSIPLVANAVSAAEAACVSPDAAVREEVLVLKAARARETAIRLADAGEHGKAMSLLQDAAADLDTLPSELALAQAEELRVAERRVAPATYDASSRKQIWFDKHRAQRRRGS